MENTIFEFRGVRGLVAAEVLTDDETNGYSAGTPFSVAGTAKLVKAVEQASETHYYDDAAAIIIHGEGSDTVTIDVSALPAEIVGRLTGQVYDDDLGALFEGERLVKYFAIGYITSDTNGHEVFVWRLKGSFNVPDEEHNTKDNSASANGQQLIFTGVQTKAKFEKNADEYGTPRGAKSVVVETAKGKCDVTNFFAAVKTPDTLVAKTARTLTITVAANTTLSVKRNGVALATGATIYDGDHLLITVTGGTVKVNNVAFTSGDIHVVTGNTTVVSTASA